MSFGCTLTDSVCLVCADKQYLLDLGITKEEFHAVTWFTSWAVDADHGSDVSDCSFHPEPM